MKTKKIITKFSLVLIIFISFYLHSCKRGDWCADCQWTCTSISPIGPNERTFCDYSLEECEERVQDFLNKCFAPDCWECTEPYEK